MYMTMFLVAKWNIPFKSRKIKSI